MRFIRRVERRMNKRVLPELVAMIAVGLAENSLRPICLDLRARPMEISISDTRTPI